MPAAASGGTLGAVRFIGAPRSAGTPAPRRPAARTGPEYTLEHEGARRDLAGCLLRARPSAAGRRVAGGVSRARGLRAGGDGRIGRALRCRARQAREARRDLGADAHGPPSRRHRRPPRASLEPCVPYRVLRALRDAQREASAGRHRRFGHERRDRRGADRSGPHAGDREPTGGAPQPLRVLAKLDFPRRVARAYPR